jgi:hypothetical protein
VYKIKNILIYFKLGIKINIIDVINLYTNGFLLIFKIYFHDIRGTPCGAPFENHCVKQRKSEKEEDRNLKTALLTSHFPMYALWKRIIPNHDKLYRLPQSPFTNVQMQVCLISSRAFTRLWLAFSYPPHAGGGDVAAPARRTSTRRY